MSYISDPLENRISQFIQQDGDSYSFSPPHSSIRISISESEYYDAEDRISLYSKVAKVFTFSIALIGTIYTDYLMINKLSGFGIIVIAAGLFIVLAIAGNSLAMACALHPLTRKFRDYTRNTLGWKRRGLRRAINDLRDLKWQFGIAALVSLVLAPIGARNYLRRSAIIDHGTTVSAHVYRSDSRNSKNTCTVRYSYSWLGKDYKGSIIGCDIMQKHPIGSTIPIRIVSGDPGYSIAEGEGFWTADFAAPFIVLGLFAFSALLILPASLSYAPRSRRRDV